MAKAPLITETDRINIAMVFRDNPKERADIIRAKVINYPTGISDSPQCNVN